MWLELKEFFRSFPSGIWCFGILPPICFLAAVNVLMFCVYLSGAYFPPDSSEFVALCLFLWAAIWVSCLVFFAAYEITNKKVGEALARIFSA